MNEASNNDSKSGTTNNTTNVIDAKTKTSEPNPDMQMLDARICIALVQFSRMRTKNEYHQWLLRNIGVPLSVKTYGNVKILYLSDDTDKVWSKDYTKPEAETNRSLLTIKEDSPMTSPGHDRSRRYYNPNLYVLSPHTHILSIATEYRTVYMVDMSASLSTLDPAEGTVLMSQVLEKLENCLDGICRPFSYRVADGVIVEIKPKIRISVIAECSQFASNINVIPLLSDHPTMKVFLQNVVLTPDNLHQVLHRLRTEFHDFQREYVSFRKSLSYRQAKTDYDLDISTEHPVGQESVLGHVQPTDSLISAIDQPVSSQETPIMSTTTPAQDSVEGKDIPRDSYYGKHGRNKNADRDAGLDARRRSSKSPITGRSKKEVWGLGRTGANLTYLLYACHLALKLLPQDGRPNVVLITDGVMKASLQEESVVKLFVEDDIACTIIQVGSGHRHAVTANFGFVPDDDILQYVAEATGGHYLLADKCRRVQEPLVNVLSQPSDLVEGVTPEPAVSNDSSYFPSTQLGEQLNSRLNEISHPVVRYLTNQETRHPNFYHNHLLIYERSLTKRKKLEAKNSHGSGNKSIWPQHGTESQTLHHDQHDRQKTILQRNYPWDPFAKPIEPVNRLLKYYEYALPTEFSHVVAARTRQGFIINSITISKSLKTLRNGLETIEDPFSFCKEHIQILMTLAWQPNVTIEYRIQASWFPPPTGTPLLSSTFLSDSESPTSGSPSSIPIDSKAMMLAGGIFSRAKAPRAEIFVRTHIEYAHMLQNWDVFTRRMQMLGVVTGSVAPGDARAAPIYEKLGRLRQSLDHIRELDEILRTIVTFNTRQLSSLTIRPYAKNSLVEPQTLRLQQYEIYVNSFKTFWESINKNEFRYQMRCFYDHASVDFLISNISPYMSPRLTSTYNQDYVSNVEAEITIGLDKITLLLSSWATLVGPDGTFVKLIHRSNFSQTPLESQRGARQTVSTPPPELPALLHLSSSSTSFCEIRLWREIGCLVTLHVVYYNVDVMSRQDVLRDLRALIQKANETEGPGSYTICKRPLSTLLMRDADHLSEADSFTHVPKALMPLQQGKKFSEQYWYMPSALWLNGQYIVQNHLRHMTWTWNTNNDHDEYHRKNKMMPLSDLAFQFLCHARLNQDYQLVLPRQDRTHFYKENMTGYSDSQACAIQYFIWKDAKSGHITTELWMEPAETPSLEDQYSYVKEDTFEFDRTCLSRLVTFDQIHSVGRLKAVAEISDDSVESNLDEDPESHIPLQTMSLSTIFDLTAALRLGVILMPLYACPRFLEESKSICSSPASWANSGSITPDNLTSPLEEMTSSMFLDEQYGSKSRPVSRPVVSSATPASKQHTLTSDMSDADFPNYKNVATYIQNHKEQFSKLNELNQDYILLHASVESAISEEITGEILLGQHDSNTLFWEAAMASMTTSVNDTFAESSLSLVKDINDMRCFVQTINPRSFIAILLPKVSVIMDALLETQETQRTPSSARSRENFDLQLLHATVEHRLKAMKETSYVPVLMFECVRQRPLRPLPQEKQNLKKNASSHSELAALLDDPLELTITPVNQPTDGINGNFDIEPLVYQGKFSTSIATLSTHSFKLQRHIDYIYAKCFMTSIYACMLQGRMVDEQDMENMVKMLRQDHIKVDITEFLNSRSLLHQLGEECNDDAEADIQHRFLSVMHYYLEPVRTSKSGQSDVYYFRPPMTFISKAGHRRKSTLSVSQGSNLDRLASYAEHPLLIRLECVFHKKADAELPEGPETQIEKVIPVSGLPTSYKSLGKSGQNFDYEPHGIGSDHSPVASRDGTRAELILVCMTIPQLLIDDHYNGEANTDLTPLKTKDDHEIDASKDAIDGWKSANISEYQKNALIESEARLSWFLKEEVMHNLLLLPTVTELTLKYIEEQLIKKNPFVDFPTSMVLPLTFVRNNERTMNVFLDELDRDESGHYHFARVNNYFYVKGEPDANLKSPSIYSLNASMNEQQDQGASAFSDDFCHGLGISVLTADEHTEMENDSQAHGMDNPHFWLILLPRQNDIQIYFYSKHHLSHRSEIIRGVKQHVLEIQEKVNRLVLLHELNETRICSKYLEVPEYTEDENLSEDNNSDEADGKNQHHTQPSSETSVPAPVIENTFQLGQFACPLLYTKKFPLHWRIPINGAFKSLATETFRMFAIKNKAHMFVIERENTVVYCKLYEESAGNVNHMVTKLKDIRTPSTIAASSTVPSTPISVTSSAAKEPFSSGTPQQRGRVQSLDGSTTEIDSSNSKYKAQDNRYLILDVYGVELPSWIEHELIEMVENRLMSHITLREMQQFLLRNPTSKLSSADVEYLLPSKKPPTKQILRIPTVVSNPISLLELVKQSLLATESFHNMAASDIKDAIVSHYHSIRKSVEEDAFLCRRGSSLAQLKSVVKVPISEYSFYYNCANRSPTSSTAVEMEAGQGLAGICIMLMDSACKPVASVPVYDDDELDYTSVNELKHVLEDEFRDASVRTANFHIMIEVWSYGQCSAEVLQKHIWRCYGQSLCHYIIRETADTAERMRRSDTLSKPQRLHTMNYHSHFDKVFLALKYAADWGSTIISPLTKHVFLQPWSIDDILAKASQEIEMITQQTPSLLIHRSSDASGSTNLDHKLPWSLHNVKHHLQQVVREADEFVIVNGLLDNLTTNRNNMNMESAIDRRGSHESELSAKSSSDPHSRRGSTDSSVLDRSIKSGKDEVARRQILGNSSASKTDDVTDPGYRKRSNSNASQRQLLEVLQSHKKRSSNSIFKHCFVIMKVDTTNLSIYTFNWPSTVSNHVINTLDGIVTFQESRAQMLSNIVHQKMGLFHHTMPFKNILEPLYTTSKLSASQSPKTGGTATMTTPPTVHKRLSEGKAKVSSPKPVEHRENPVTLDSLTELVFLSGTSSSIAAAKELNRSQKGQEKVHTAARVLQPNNILRDIVFENTCSTTVSKVDDPLIRHAQGFLETYLRQSRIRTAHEKAFKVYSKWASRYVDLSNHSSMETISSSDLTIIMGSARLLHFCRTPLVFASINTPLPTKDDEDEASSPKAKNPSSCASKWYTDVVKTLLKEYATYLEGVGMHIISFDTQEDGTTDQKRGSDAIPTVNTEAESPTVYLLKVFDGGSVLCQVRVYEGFVSVTLYTLHRRYGRLSQWAYADEGRETKRHRFKAFTEECDNFKTLIHVNSFVFDFHLRYMQRMLGTPEKLSSSVNLLAAIRAFERLYTNPANYSRNRIVSGYIHVDIDISAERLLSTAYRHANKIDCKALHHDSSVVACFVNSNDPTFNETVASTTPFQFSLILCSLDKHDEDYDKNTLRLRYFVIVTYNDTTISNHSKPTPLAILKSHPSIGHVDPLDELLAPEIGLTLGQVVRSAQTKIDSMISKLLMYYRRDLDWSHIYERVDSHNYQKIAPLLHQFDTVDLMTAEPNFARYLEMSLPWDKVLDLIGKCYGGGVRKMENNGEKHLLLFNARYMDYLMHFRVGNGIKVEMVSREPRSQLLEPAEKQQITEIGTLIGYLLWRLR
ncbi:hypothetical protein BC943DRAFT_153411 [Umbelopsis sp. AD052]|nr:hypothetical protein BC943DRAFT_153411 [Umbelopsis sp. AD052]